MTDDSYTGQDAREELEQERLETQKKNLKKAVEERESVIEEADEFRKDLKEALKEINQAIVSEKARRNTLLYTEASEFDEDFDLDEESNAVSEDEISGLSEFLDEYGGETDFREPTVKDVLACMESNPIM